MATGLPILRLMRPRHPTPRVDRTRGYRDDVRTPFTQSTSAATFSRKIERLEVREEFEDLAVVDSRGRPDFGGMDSDALAERESRRSVIIGRD